MTNNSDLVSLLQDLTPAQARDLVNDLEPGQLEAIEALLADQVLARALAVAAQEFTAEGYAAFFHFFNGFPLHQEGRKWVEKIFEAWRGNRRLLQKAFRGSGKTTVFSKYFLLFFIGHFPHTTSGVVRISQNKARETASTVARTIELDPRWGKVFPGVVPDKKAGWGVETGYYVKRIDLDPDPDTNEEKWQTLMSKSERPQGATVVGYGYTEDAIIGSRWNGIMLVDDLHDIKNTRSATLLQEVKEFVTLTMQPIPVPGQTLEVWCYTRWNVNDAYGVREGTGLYIESFSPVMTEAEPEAPGAVFFPEDDDRLPAPFPYGGRWWYLAWPERWDYDAILLKYIDIGPVSFALMYMLDIEASKGIVLQDSWLHVYPARDIKPEWQVIFGVDYASTADKQHAAKKDRDYFALAAFRVLPSGGLVLFDGVRDRCSRAEALDHVASWWNMYPTALVVGVETIGKGQEFYDDLVLINTENKGDRPIRLEKVTHHRTGKGDRFENWLAPRFSTARIWISSVENEFLTHFRDEWLSYPRGVHDDTLDAAYMGAFVGNAFLGVYGTRPEKTADQKALEADPVYQTIKKNAREKARPKLKIASPRIRRQRARQRIR